MQQLNPHVMQPTPPFLADPFTGRQLHLSNILPSKQNLDLVCMENDLQFNLVLDKQERKREIQMDMAREKEEEELERQRLQKLKSRQQDLNGGPSGKNDGSQPGENNDQDGALHSQEANEQKNNENG